MNVSLLDPWMEFRNRALEIELRWSFKWVNISGVPDLEGLAALSDWKYVISSGVSPVLQNLRLRDPNNFLVGGLHQNVGAWENILKGHPLEERIRDWIQNKVNILDFSIIGFCIRNMFILVMLSKDWETVVFACGPSL